MSIISGLSVSSSLSPTFTSLPPTVLASATSQSLSTSSTSSTSLSFTSSTATPIAGGHSPSPSSALAPPLSMPADQSSSHQQLQPQLQRQWHNNQQHYYEKWQQNYRQRIDGDLLARVFLCTNLCQSTFEYIMRFLHEKYSKTEVLQVPMEIFDIIFETEAGKRSRKRPPRPIEPCEKIVLFICLVKQYPELTNAIVKESGKDSREFFNNQTEDAPPERSIVDWLLHQSWNETNIFDILQIAAQTAQTAYFAHGLPFALMRDKNPRYQVQEYTDNTGKLKSVVPEDDEEDNDDVPMTSSTGNNDDDIDMKTE